MGYWKLKPEIEIGPYKALSITQDTLLDFIQITSIEDGYELTEFDIEHIFNEVREGIYMGEFNDWDWLSDQELEAAI